jgi:hypothetical protein
MSQENKFNDKSNLPVLGKSADSEHVKMHDFDVDPMNVVDEFRQMKETEKKKIQLTFENVIIKTIPKSKKCCKPKGYEPPKVKTILDNVSGTILPG